jgi:hypothetical protein
VERSRMNQMLSRPAIHETATPRALSPGWTLSAMQHVEWLDTLVKAP